jgi:hypothetical protein
MKAEAQGLPWHSLRRSEIASGSAFGQVKADQKARGLYLAGDVPIGFERGDDGELVPKEAQQEAIREMVALRWLRRWRDGGEHQHVFAPVEPLPDRRY